MWALVLIGFFHSIMFPTIFALSIKNLGPLTKRGSSLQVMAILGGAILPAIMGRISDVTNIRTAFVCSSRLLRLHFLFRRERLQAAQCRKRRSANHSSNGTGIMTCRSCLFASLTPTVTAIPRSA